MGFAWVNLGLFDFLCLVRFFWDLFGSVWDLFVGECCGVLVVCSWCRDIVIVVVSVCRARDVLVLYSRILHIDLYIHKL